MAIRAQHERFPKGITVSDIRFSRSLYSDYLFSGIAIGKGSNAPDLAELRNGLFLQAFAGTGVTVEQGFFNIHILHNMRPGSSPTIHIHWTHNQASPSGDVKWQIDYSVSKGYEAGTYAAPTTVTTTQAAGTQYSHHITDDDDMVLTGGFEPDSVIIGRIYRDPADVADTFEADAFLVHVDVHFEMDRIGTPERNRIFSGY